MLEKSIRTVYHQELVKALVHGLGVPPSLQRLPGKVIRPRKR